jgi:hypothetical protein
MVGWFARSGKKWQVAVWQLAISETQEMLMDVREVFERTGLIAGDPSIDENGNGRDWLPPVG